MIEVVSSIVIAVIILIGLVYVIITSLKDMEQRVPQSEQRYGK
jgi:hypothetical protein